MVSWSDDDSSENSHQYADSASDKGIIKEGRKCGLVEWVDPFWLATLENALTKLWDKYEECGRSKIEDNLESSFVVHNLTQQKIKLQTSYESLVEDVNGLLDAQDQRARMERGQMQNKPDENKLQEKYDMLKNLTIAQANVIRNMKLKLAEENIKLRAHINELEKVVEQTKLKLNGIKAILDE
ncbi:hypothetical protein VPH35_024389 [Triticum aestivum]